MPSAGEPSSGDRKAVEVPDPAFELTLRPAALPDFTGQTRIKERLGILIEAAR
jgi:Holliday junction DNA helicase RuvB